MILLSDRDIDKVINVIESSVKTVPTFTYSVLNNFIKGFVYANSRDPETVLVGTETGIYFVAGKEDNEKFNNFLFELYFQRKSNDLRFTLFSSTASWDSVIQRLFNNNLNQVSRYSYIYDHKKKAHNKGLTDSEYSIRRISEEQITSSLEFNKDYYNEYWGSVSNFTEKGFGYCILHKGKVVSECTSIFSSLQFAEIDIETNEDYRGQGLASIVAKAFINHCLKDEIIPRWDCDILNKQSIILAEKLGFINPNKYSIFTLTKQQNS